MSLTVEQITAGYEKEREEYSIPVSRGDLPLAYEDITPQWLDAVLCAVFPGAAVESIALDEPDEGNSNRRRLFVTYNEAGHDAKLPDTIFCKASHGLANRISLGMTDCMQNEANFYNLVRHELDIEAPVCYFANYNQALNSIVMLKDMDERTQFCNYATTITRELVEDQLGLLAKLHGRYLQSPELGGSLAAFSTWTDFFAKLDYPDFENACDKGFEVSEPVIPPRLFKRRKEIWPATLTSTIRHLELPHTLTHGDDHLGNWYITADGKMGLMDWQGLNRGHWSRDVAYAVVTSLTIEDRRAWLDDLLLYYHSCLEQVSGSKISFDGVLDLIGQQLLSILAYWTITANPTPDMPDMQPKEMTLEMIRRITTAIDDLDAMDSFR